MRMMLSILGCVGLVWLSPARADDTRLAQVLPLPHRTPAKHMAGRMGQHGIKTTDWTDKPKTAQDIADEKKLKHDLEICKGC